MHLVINTSKQGMRAWLFFLFLKLNYDVHILAADDVTFAMANFLLAMMTYEREADRYTAVMRCN